MEQRETCACERAAKSSLFCVQVPGALEACHASAIATPLPFYTLSKATVVSMQAEPFHSAEPLLSCSFLLPSSPQAAPALILPQLDNGKKLNREVATIFLRLNEVLALSCTPKKEMTSVLANELFIFY